jgi:hypothetical protein
VRIDATAPPPDAAPSTLLAGGGGLAGPADESQRVVRAIAIASSWLSSDAMRDLVALFGGRLDAEGGILGGDDAPWLHLNEELPEWVGPVVRGTRPVAAWGRDAVAGLRSALALESWAAEPFNFRGTGATYVERNQAVSAEFDDETRSRVVEHAGLLGLTGATRPRHDSYDGTLVLGGGWRSPLLRARYAAVWRRAGTDLGHLYFLGSPRFLVTDPPERDRTEGYAPGARDEFDLLVAAGASEFELRPQPTRLLCGCTGIDDVCPQWRFAGSDLAAETPPQYTHERATELSDATGATRGTVLSASTGRPPYRPDTTDTLELWARQALPQPGMRVLVVTTQVFVPFQSFDSVKRLYLPHGVDVDVVGYAADWGDRPETAEYLLQETLSAIRSARRLLVEAVSLAGTAGEC